MTSNYGTILKQSDYDRYLCSLFANSTALQPLWVLYNFNLEIANIAPTNSDPMVGLIRLAWWREAVSDIYLKKQVDHPLLQDLASIIAKYNLPEQSFIKIFKAREFDFEQTNPKNIHAIEHYAEMSCGVLFELALKILQVEDKRVYKMAAHLGIAWAVIGHIRALPHNPLSARLIMPENLQQQYGSTNYAKILAELVDMASDHLSYVLVARHVLSRKALPVFLLATIIRIFIKRIKQNQFNPWQSNLENNRFPVLLKVLLSGITGRI